VGHEVVGDQDRLGVLQMGAPRHDGPARGLGLGDQGVGDVEQPPGQVAREEWVRERFKTTIPQTALELVTPAHMDDENPSDEFLIWVNRVAG